MNLATSEALKIEASRREIELPEEWIPHHRHLCLFMRSIPRITWSDPFLLSSSKSRKAEAFQYQKHRIIEILYHAYREVVGLSAASLSETAAYDSYEEFSLSEEGDWNTLISNKVSELIVIALPNAAIDETSLQNAGYRFIDWEAGAILFQRNRQCLFILPDFNINGYSTPAMKKNVELELWIKELFVRMR